MKNYTVDDKGILPPYLPGGERWKLETRFYADEFSKPFSGYDVYVSLIKTLL